VLQGKAVRVVSVEVEVELEQLGGLVDLVAAVEVMPELLAVLVELLAVAVLGQQPAVLAALVASFSIGQRDINYEIRMD
jgi:hypothetical protein